MYGMVCATCMCGIGGMGLVKAPSFVGVFANSLP